MSDSLFGLAVDVDALLQIYDELGGRIGTPGPSGEAFRGVIRVAVSNIEGTSFASMTRDRGDHFETLAPSLQLATDADRLQYALSSGPCVDTLAADTPGDCLVSDDMRTDQRWPVFGPRVFETCGVISMLSLRLVVDSDVRMSLNLYSRHPAAFAPLARATAVLLATHAGAVLAGVLSRERVERTERALQASRRIGMAVGVLMASRKLTSEKAFDLLRIVSQQRNRRVADVAEAVLETGDI